MSGRRAIEVLAACPLLEPLPETALQRLADASVRRSYAADGALFRTGDLSRWLFVIDSGHVRTVRRAGGGRELVLHVAGPGETPGHTDLIDGGPRTVDTTAVDAVEVVAVPAEALRRAMLAHPEALMRLAEDLIFIVRELDVAVEVGHNQNEMAARLGVVRQSFNRTLASLQARGLIRVTPGGRRVELVDRHGLEALERAGR